MNNTCSLFLLIIFIFYSFSTSAQQDALYSQYMFNNLAYNPAYAGSQNKVNASLLYRNQYVGISNIPVSQNFLIHAPFYHKKIGLGLQVFNQNSNWYNYLEINVLYAYRIIFNKGVLSMGIGAGIQQQKMSINAQDYKDQQDDVINALQRTYLIPNMQAGAYYQKKNWYIGLSFRNMFSPYYNSEKDYFAPQKLHLYIQGGGKYKLSPDIHYVPTFLIKHAAGFQTQLDITQHILYKNSYWAGISYRTMPSLAFQAGFRLDKVIPTLQQGFRIGYAFDWNMNVSMASHEIMLIIDWEKHKSPEKIRKQKVEISPFFQ